MPFAAFVRFIDDLIVAYF